MSEHRVNPPVDTVPQGEYVSDGHLLLARVYDGVVDLDLACPGEGRCQDPNRDASGKPLTGENWGCNLKEWFRAVGGGEFAEWQEKPTREAPLPCLIEWRYTGWDDSAELWWRPVSPDDQNEATRTIRAFVERSLIDAAAKRWGAAVGFNVTESCTELHVDSGSYLIRVEPTQRP